MITNLIFTEVPGEPISPLRPGLPGSPYAKSKLIRNFY